MLANRIAVVITIDTEPDNVWADHHSTELRSIDELLRLQCLLDRFDAKATLLITHTVASNPRAVETLQRLLERGAEIGAHLHPWDNPPFMPCGLDRRHHTFPHELPESIYRQKMEVLTESISRHLPSPTSYRAGRYGLAADHVRVLEELGYRVDSSVTPLCSWKGTLGLPRSENGRGGIDYRRAPLDPYYLHYEDVTRPGEAGLLEIPVTVYSTYNLHNALLCVLAMCPELLQRGLRWTTGLTLAWARPTGQPRGSVPRMLCSWMRRHPNVVNIMFHSSELLLGGSPSTRTPEQLRDVLQCLEDMLQWLAQQPGVEFCTLSTAAQWLGGRTSRSSRSRTRSGSSESEGASCMRNS